MSKKIDKGQVMSAQNNPTAPPHPSLKGMPSSNVRRSGLTITAKGKSIVTYVTKEDQTFSMNVAKYPVEQGEPISTHAQYDSNVINVTGYALGKDLKEAGDIVDQLMLWEVTGQLVDIYSIGTDDEQYLISSLKKTFEDNPLENAIAIEYTLTKIRIPKNSTYTEKSNNGKKQPSKTPAAIYVTVKSGNTYWGFNRQFGTSIQQLRNWNKYPDRFIPIGVKIRVK